MSLPATLGRWLDHRWLVAMVAGAGLAFALAVALLTPPQIERSLMVEAGPFETSSAILHFIAVAAALSVYGRARGVMGLAALASGLMAVRELDWHKAWTTHGVFSTKLYFRDYVPLAEKLIAGAVVLGLAVLMVFAIRRSRADLRQLFEARAPALWGLATLAVVAPILKLIDGLPRMLAKAGLALDAETLTILLAIEEIGETFLPILMITVIAQVAHAMKTDAPSATVSVAYIG